MNGNEGNEENEKKKPFSGEAVLIVGVLRDMVNAVKTLSGELVMDVGKNGWHVKLTDPAHIAMMEMDIPKKCFIKCKASREGRIVIDTGRLATFLRGLGEKELISVAWSEKERRIAFEHDRLTLRLVLRDCTDVSTIRMPNLELPGHFVVPHDEFCELVKLHQKIGGDHIIIWFDEGGSVVCGSEEKSEYELSGYLTVGKGIRVQGKLDKVDSPLPKSIFPLDYLVNILKHGLQNADDVWCSLGVDYPIALEASVGKLQIPVKFLLAPLEFWEPP